MRRHVSRVRKLFSGFALCVLAGSITIELQGWIGSSTTYSQKAEEQRGDLHARILQRHIPPGGTIGDFSFQNATMDDVMGLVAESARQATGWEVTRVYKWIDNISLFIALLLLYALLGAYVPPSYRALGVLYLASILPLTYQSGVLHPWDRPSTMTWLFVLLALERMYLLAFTWLLAAGLVGHDSSLVHRLRLVRTDSSVRLTRIMIEAAVMIAFAMLAYMLLESLVPTRRDGPGMMVQLDRNFDQLRHFGAAYPPIFMFVIPACFAAIGWRGSDRRARAGVVLSLLGIVMLFFVSDVSDVRGKIPLLVLLLPCALYGARLLLDGEEEMRVEDVLIAAAAREMALPAVASTRAADVRAPAPATVDVMSPVHVDTH
jgi:hypothetical protein